MYKLKILFQQVFMISTGILFMNGVCGAVSYMKGTEFFFPWYYPFSIILLGCLCTVPTSLFILHDWGKHGHFIVNLILHYLSVGMLTAIIGWIFHWYFSWFELLRVVIEFTAIYVFVWGTTIWLMKVDDKKINQALQEIQDDE